MKRPQPKSLGMKVMFRPALLLSAYCLLTFFGIAQEDTDPEQAPSLYEAVVAPDRTLLRRLEQADRLFEAGRSAEAAGLLGNTLENANSAFIVPETAAESPVRTLRETVNDQIIDRLRKLPKEAQDSYAFQFEATAKRLLENALSETTRTDDSLSEIHNVAQKYFPTSSGASAVLFIGLTQFERGDHTAAFLTLDKLKRLHPALPDTVSSVLEPLLQELQLKFQHSAEPTNISESAWLEQIGWRLPAGSPAQHAPTNASPPLFEHSWTLPIHSRLQKQRETDLLVRSLQAGEDVYIPAAQPLVTGHLFITRSYDEIIAADFVSGKRLWTARAPEYRFPDKMSVPPLPAGGTPLRFFFWHDRITHQLSSNGSAVFSIDDYDMQRMDIQSFGRFPKLRGTIEDPRYTSGNTLTARDVNTGQILWQAGKFPYVQKSIDVLFSQKDRSASAGESALDETIFTDDEKAMRETWFLGAPLPLNGRLYVIGETDGVLHLFVLEPSTGRLIRRQAFAQIPSSLLANVVRRTYPLFPSASSGIVICPTGNGLLTAMDAATLSPIWCFTYADAPSAQPVNRMLRNQQRQLPGMSVSDIYVRQLFDNSGWQVPGLMIHQEKVVAAPPDQAALYCLDLRSGECLWDQTISRLNALYTACIQNDKVFVITPISIMAFDMNTGEDVSFEGHRFQTALRPVGKGVHSGSQYVIPFTEGYLAVADLNEGTLTWLDAAGSVTQPPAQDGSTTASEGIWGFSGQSRRYYGHIPTLFSPDLTTDSLFPQTLHFGNLVGIKGRFFSQSPTQIACFDQKAVIQQQSETLLRNDPNDPEGLRQRGRILQSEGQLAEAIAAFRASLKAKPSIEAADSLRKNLLEALRTDYTAWSSSGQELESLAELPEEKGIALYAQIEGMLQSGRTDELEPLLERVAALGQRQAVFVPVDNNYAAQLPRAVESLLKQKGIKQKDVKQPRPERQATMQQAKTQPAAPFVWNSGKVTVEDVTSSYNASERLATIEKEVDQIVARLVNIAKNSGQPSSAGQQLTIPFLGIDDPELSTLEFVVKPAMGDFLLCCNDSSGQERWRLTLPAVDVLDLGRQTNDSESFYIQGFRHFLLFVQGNTMTALDTSASDTKLGTAPKILWTKTASSILLGPPSGRSRAARSRQSPEFSDSFPKNSVFVSPEVVCCWDAQCVYGLEPLTGQRLWVRRTTDDHCSLLGDAEHLFLVFPGKRYVVAVDPSSGRELAVGQLPSGGIHAFNTNILCVRRREMSNTATLTVCDLRDIYDKRRRALLVADVPPAGQWAPPIPENVISEAWGDRALMQISYSGQFLSLAAWETKSLQIYDLQTKKNVLPENNKLLDFVPEGKTDQMRCDVEWVDDRFLVLFTKNTAFAKNDFEPYEVQGKPYQRSFGVVRGVMSADVGDGALMLFDSAGNPCWPNPVEIKNWSRLLDVPEHLPVMLFTAAVSDKAVVNGEVQRTAEQSTGIMGIDKRTGQRRFRSTISGQPALQSFRVHVEPQSQEIFFITPGSRVIKAAFFER